MKYTVLDPSEGPQSAGLEMAPRPANLNGVTVGVIDNGKRNADYVLKGIVERLKERYGIGPVVFLKKSSASRPISEDAARELAEKCRVVISGIGD
jgi:hypothetical protein